MSPDEGDGYDPDTERVQESAARRSRERAEITEDQLGDVGAMLDEEKYPTTGEELAVEYADETIDLPNETESLGSVFDRLTDERFESPDDAREAILNELTGAAAGPEEYNDERALSGLTDDEVATEGEGEGESEDSPGI